MQHRRGNLAHRDGLGEGARQPGVPDGRRLAVAQLGPAAEGPGGMEAVLRGLLGSPLAERHDLVEIATHREGGLGLRLSVFARGLAAFTLWSLRAPCGLAHVHVTVRGSMYRKTLVAALAVALGRPLVLHVHAGATELEAFHARLGPVRRASFRWAFRAAERVVAVSGASGHVLEERYGAPPVEILPNAVEQIGPAPAPPPDSQRAPRILFLGGFANPVKGGSVLVEALPALRTACPRARVDLAGPGSPPAGLAAGGDEVRWLGWLDVSSTRAALAGADLFVLPSTSEGLPVALLEAMAHGKGIVATRVGGVPEVVEHGRQGVLVPPGDPAALARALAELAGDLDRARALGARARERVCELAPERIAERLDALYREVVGGKEEKRSLPTRTARRVRADGAGVPALGKRGGPVANRSPHAVFLCYHSIAEQGPEWLSLPPDLFERQLALLRRHGYVSGDTETLQRLSSGWRPPRPQVFITFDDGFADNHAVAAGLLREYGFSAFVFVLPPLLEHGAPLAWPEVEASRRAHPDVMRSMTWSQVEELAAAGWTVGSHTLSHPSLPACDPQRRAEELLDSRSIIRERLGRCDLLAYPFGDWSPAVTRAAAAAGYSAAFTIPGTGQWRANALSIPRIAVDHRDTERRFAVKLSATGRALLLSPLKAVVRASRFPLAVRGR